MRKRILSVLLCIVMALSLIPTCAVAAADIASGSGWYIDGDGCLHITGAVTNTNTIEEFYRKSPFYPYREKVVSIVAENGASIDNGIGLFFDFENLVSVDLSRLDTSKVTEMYKMFSICSSLSSLDVSSFDTSKVTNMAGMFGSCSNLTKIDLTGFDTSNVTNMRDLFSNCKSLTSLDVTGFNTAKVTDMGSMFYGCENLLTLDLTSFNTSNVTEMSHMFSHCTSLMALDVTGFDTSKTEKMGFMFSECKNLSKIDISNFSMESTKSYSDRYYMFQACESLVEITIKHDFLYDQAGTLLNISPEWKNKETGEVYTSEDVIGHLPGKVTLYRDSVEPDLNGWYFSDDGCLHITGAVNNQSTGAINYTPWKAYKNHIKTVVTEPGASVNNAAFLFAECANLTSADLSHLDTTGVTDMHKMFYGCKSLTSVNLNGLNTADVTDMSHMFNDCIQLWTLDVSSFNTANVQDMKLMFCNCYLLVAPDLSGFNTAQVQDMRAMFTKCSNFKTLDLSSFNVDNVLDMQSMFYDCNELRELNISSFNFTDADSVSDMLSGCKKLVELTANDTAYPKVADQLIGISAEWVNKDSGAAYPDVDSFNHMEFIDGRATITRVATFYSATGWHFDSDGTLYITDRMPNYINVVDYSLSLDQPWHFWPYGKLLSVIAEPGSSVENFNYLFAYSRDLISVDLIDLDLSNVAYARDIFLNCDSLERVSAKPELFRVAAENLISISSTWKDALDGTFYTDAEAIKSISKQTVLVRLDTIASGEGWTLYSDGALYITGDVTNPSTVAFDETPWRRYKNQIESVVTQPGASVDNCAYLFANCPNLTEMDLSELDTHKATNMHSMFENCSSLTSTDVSSLITNDVTNMSLMFSGCSSLETLNIKYFDTSNVTNFNHMFNGCESLTALDVRGFKTSNAEYMANMFAGCSSIESLDLNGFNTSNVSSMNGMFNGCSSIYILDVSNFDITNLRYADNMFTGCSGLNELDINGDLIAKTASQLMDISLSWFNATDGMIYSDEESLKTITGSAVLATVGIVESGEGWALDELGNLFITGAVSNPTGTSDKVPWKDYRSDIKTVTAKPGASVDNGKLLFNNCTNLKTLDLTELDISGVVGVTNMIGNCSALNTIAANPAVFSAIANQMITLSSSWVNVSTNAVYSTAAELKGIKTNVTLEKVAKGDGWYLDTSGVLHITGAVTNPSAYEDETPWKDYKNRIVSVVTAAGASLNKADYLFMNCPNLVTVDLSNLNASALNGFYYSFANCQSLKSVNFGNINTPNLKTLECMFMNDSSLESVDLSRLNTEKVWQFQSLFDGCSSLKTVYLGNRFVTAEAKYLGNMFQGCNSLQEIDVSSFDTSSVTTMTNMFKGCSSLTSLDLSALNVDKVTVNNSYNYMDGILVGCTSLEELRANSVLLGKIAPEVIALYPVWTNVTTGRIYTTAADLQMITGTVTLVRDVPGDVTGDRKVTSADLTALLRHVAKIQLLGNTANADLNKDGKIDAADVTKLAQMLSK